MRLQLKSITTSMLGLLLFSISLASVAQSTDSSLSEPKSASQAKTVVLVRHAEKIADGSRNPMLTQAGHQRALALKEALQPLELSQLIASNYQRTQMTLDPIASQRSLPVIIADTQFGVAAHVASVVTLVKQTSGNSLIAGHSNTVPLIIKALGGPSLPTIDEAQYGTLYQLSITELGDVSLSQSHFGK
ncbi:MULTISPECIES: phosphoglycerate mutase family protein [unclassified Shewanella]|uniref:phosphoglycerate mutase family protein n=1 Tax=unclassified Shewanella TaxID=196818 RepID=UPI001BBB9CCA|nr:MULTISPECIES: phosphoglycerate mutase family protein [unclassified Shewanella]GIU11768.1 phosphoglycerate mutase [Shewanella sp. MBTL60-112-B1]GIU32091.1 phosphoglycerate mutase [Shewanella sp. MBTL60-112-B2]